MTTPEVLDILRKFKYAFSKKFGIKSLGIFGSFARSQQDESSDVDVVVTLEDPDFFILVSIQEELEKLTGYKVDVVNFRDSLRESFKNNILKDAIFV
ncbi:MAG: nucleotidyltransferase domain-containing protein [Oscillibacter sp.]|nr:nucleotidyltransferase domain-containing protein [Oscillibacter sp.]